MSRHATVVWPAMIPPQRVCATVRRRSGIVRFDLHHPSMSISIGCVTMPTRDSEASPARRPIMEWVGSKGSTPQSHRLFVRVAALSTGLAVLNGIVGIGSHSIARDEGFSISTSLRSWTSLVWLTLHIETNAWLYAMLLKAWSGIGSNLILLRLPSLIAFAATAPLTAVVARRLFGDRIGATSGLIVAVSGSLLMYANQVRSYSLAAAMGVATTLLFLAEVRNPRRSTLLAWMGFAVLTAQTSLHAFSIVAVHLVSLFGLPAHERRWLRRIGASIVGTGLTIPVVIAVSVHEEGQGLVSIRLDVFRDIIQTLGGHGGVPGALGFGVAAIGFLVLTRNAWVNGDLEQRFPLLLVGAWMTLPFVLLLLTSIVVQPSLNGRYLLFCVPGMAIALAVTLDRLVRLSSGLVGNRRFLLRSAAAGLAVTAAYGSVVWHFDRATEHWNEVTTYVFDNARSSDRLVVANDSIRLFFEYERTQRTRPPVGPQPGYPDANWGAFGTGDQSYLSPSAAQMSWAAARAERLWVVIGRDHVNTKGMDQRLAELSPEFRLVQVKDFPVNIQVYLYTRDQK
jgi:hypothetical protein